jgi:hydroxymethylglutaryl-CoA lyase
MTAGARTAGAIHGPDGYPDVVIYLLSELGFDTGVDLDKLIESVVLAEEILGHRLYPMDMPFVETLDQAQHFRLGPDSYAGALSPWKEPITSPFRSEG